MTNNLNKALAVEPLSFNGQYYEALGEKTAQNLLPSVNYPATSPWSIFKSP